MKPDQFYVIDDNHFNNSLCRLVIKRTLGNNNVETFIDPEKGFEHIVSEFKRTGIQKPTILLLDINMPTMSGWEFLGFFDKLDPEIKKNIFVCILSSSVDPRDKKRADDSPYVMEYIVKPITAEILLDLMSKFD